MDGQSSWEKTAGQVVVTAGPLVAAAAGYGYGVPVWAPAALAATATAGMAARGWMQRRPWSERAFQVAAGVTAGAWTTWSTWSGPWHLPNLIAGAAASVLALAIAPAFVGDDAPVSAPVEEQSAAPAKDPVLVWKDRIERLAKIQPMELLGPPEPWPNDAGFTLKLAFAEESGDGWDSIDSAKHKIARAARLPTGCVLGVSEGGTQGTAVLRVPTKYVMDRNLDLPEDFSTLSVKDDFPIGGNEDTTPALVNIRQSAGLLAGRRGGGKTNLLKVFIGQILRCRDSLVWVVDLNGGGAAVPFMLPYVDGEVAAPPIDWIAASPEEAILMAGVAAAIAKDRKARYGALTARANDDLLPVTKDLPQITIIVDESAEVEEDPKARNAMDKLQEVLRIGRAEAVNVIFSALRATAGTIPINTRKQTALKICGQVEDESELDYVLPGAKVRAEDLIHPGTVFMRRSDLGKSVRQVKVYRTAPATIRRLVIATASTRPALDQPGQQIGGEVYAERWTRLRPWLNRIADSDDEVGTELPSATVRSAAPASPANGGGVRQTAVKAPVVPLADRPPLSPEERDALRQRAREGLRRLAARDESKQLPKERVDDTFAAMMADVDLEPADDADAEAPTDENDDQGAQSGGPQMDVLLDIIRTSGPIGPTGMVDELAKRGISTTTKTLHSKPYLPRLVEEGTLEKVTVNGKVKYQIC